MRFQQSEFLLLAVVGFAFFGIGAGLGRTLAECQAIASKFQNTCSTAPYSAATSVASMDGVNVSCTMTATDLNYCAGTVSGSVCTWTRRLCVSCFSTNNVVYIRMQTNTLPGHCYKAPTTPIVTNIDFSVPFNPAVTINATSGLPTPRASKTDPKTQSEVTTLLCGEINQLIPNSDAAGLTFVSGSQSMNTGVGVWLGGVPLLHQNSAEQVDPFYPRAYGSITSVSAEMTDICTGHPSGANMYHYHIMPVCHSSSAYITQSASCGGSNAATCYNRFKDYALAGWSNNKTLTVAGIAKDGRIIYGPYWSDGTLVSAGLDVCNGAYFDEDGDGVKDTYAYFMTPHFPYFAGCMGPGSFPSYQPECTTNPIPVYTSVIPAPVPVAAPSNPPVAAPVATPKAAPSPKAPPPKPAPPVAPPKQAPVSQPVQQPSTAPVAVPQPTAIPEAAPVAGPVAQPSAQPVAQPAVQPVSQPVAQPTSGAASPQESVPAPVMAPQAAPTASQLVPQAAAATPTKAPVVSVPPSTLRISGAIGLQTTVLHVVGVACIILLAL